MNAKKILWRPKFGRFSLSLAIFGHSGQILTIEIMFGLFMQKEKVSKQYFLYWQTDTETFGNFNDNVL